MRETANPTALEKLFNKRSPKLWPKKDYFRELEKNFRGDYSLCTPGLSHLYPLHRPFWIYNSRSFMFSFIYLLDVFPCFSCPLRQWGMVPNECVLVNEWWQLTDHGFWAVTSFWLFFLVQLSGRFPIKDNDRGNSTLQVLGVLHQFSSIATQMSGRHHSIKATVIARLCYVFQVFAWCMLHLTSYLIRCVCCMHPCELGTCRKGLYLLCFGFNFCFFDGLSFEQSSNRFDSFVFARLFYWEAHEHLVPSKGMARSCSHASITVVFHDCHFTPSSPTQSIAIK